MLLRSFLVFFYEGFSISMAEVELNLKDIGTRVKQEFFVSFKSVLQALYEFQDDSPAIKHKINIDRSIYALKDFDSNRRLRAREHLSKGKKKSRDLTRNRLHVSKMLDFGSHLLSIQRRSRTLDLSQLVFAKSTLQPGVSVQKDKDKCQDQSKLSKAFFLMNFFQVKREFRGKADFSNFFQSFYAQIHQDFKLFAVGRWGLILGQHAPTAPSLPPNPRDAPQEEGPEHHP